MAPATDKNWYKLSTMHKVFAWSAFALFVSTIIMMVDDYDDEWRDYQRTGFRLATLKARQQEEQILKDPRFNARVDELDKQLGSANDSLSDQQEQIDVVQNEFDEKAFTVGVLNRKAREERAKRDVARANYDIAVRDAKPQQERDDLQRLFNTAQVVVGGLETELQVAQTEQDLAAAKLNSETKARDDIEAELSNVRTDLDRLIDIRNKISPTNIVSRLKRNIMELPIIDGFNSHIKIKQDWLPKLSQPLGMTSSARFDRCRTCHMNIDLVGSGNVPTFPAGHPDSNNPEDWVQENQFPQPFSTHPHPDLYLTAASPHPLPEFGCTSCHDGQGSGTSFQNASHSPNEPHQAHEWEHDFDYFHNHFWEYPMTPKRFNESTCLKCHHSVTELGINPKFGATAPKLFEGYQLIQKYGCFGCHEINGYDSGVAIGPDLRLEPNTEEEAKKIADDPKAVAGQMRKVGPSLRHVADKTTEGFLSYWTEEPKRFRPTTRMPQFFDLANQDDAHAVKFQPVELAGIAQFLMQKSTPVELMKPQAGYQPNAERGRKMFSERGCLACHSHVKFPEAKSSFGPNLSKIHEKVRAGQEGFGWLYTWVKNPERHHPRTKMPNLFLDPQGEGEKYIDPAADIAAFLLAGKPGSFPNQKFSGKALDELVVTFLSKTLTEAKVRETLAEWKYPVGREFIKGDEIELSTESGEAVSEKEWQTMKLNYIGRRTISRYGCFGCHDIPGFENARPIGTPLQDWGRKDPSKLAPEHIEEYLHHHGEPNGGSTLDRVTDAIRKASGHEFGSPEEKESELSAAYFYESLIHHGRPGFLWQKLRSPRSYDFRKTETKGYDERLKMPKFPFDERQIESVATFVLGLTAEPPSEQYQYHPTGRPADRIEGERLLEKYNCGGCHIIDLPEIQYRANLDDIFASDLSADEYEAGKKLLFKLNPVANGLAGKDSETGEPIVRFHGLASSLPDPEDDIEDQEYGFDLWETLDVGGKILFPGEKMLVPAQSLLIDKSNTGRGGDFARVLVNQLMETTTKGVRNLAWQMAPPPLYKEGVKVQTPWLYQFLQNPGKIRHTTVLRMPKFNMSADEARSLANYFAAVDGAPYPYQRISERESDYLDARALATIEQAHGGQAYLDESWKVLNATLCMKCHSVGGKQVKISDPEKDIRGPDLDLTAERLRPEWTLLWLYKPQWITPFTSMPAPLPKSKKTFPGLFKGVGGIQTIGLRDALMNYNRLMEDVGNITYPPKDAAGQQSGE